MANAKITLSIDPKVYDAYKKHCGEKGLVMSKQVEIFMENELRKVKK